VKKTKQPGENISLKTKKTEDPAVMNWINAQTNLMDSLRYLVENEIARNGVRNLQAFIPAERNVLGMRAEGLELIQDELAVTVAPVEPFRSDPEPTAKAVEEEDIDEDDIEAWT
jgi:hypothetical protein